MVEKSQKKLYRLERFLGKRGICFGAWQYLVYFQKLFPIVGPFFPSSVFPEGIIVRIELIATVIRIHIACHTSSFIEKVYKNGMKSIGFMPKNTKDTVCPFDNLLIFM